MRTNLIDSSLKVNRNPDGSTTSFIYGRDIIDDDFSNDSVEKILKDSNTEFLAVLQKAKNVDMNCISVFTVSVDGKPKFNISSLIEYIRSGAGNIGQKINSENENIAMCFVPLDMTDEEAVNLINGSLNRKFNDKKI